MKEAGVNSRRRRILRVVMWLCAASALLMVVSWIWGSFGTCSIGGGGLRVSVTASQLQLAIANQPVIRRPEAWYFPRASVGVLLPSSNVRPTTSTAAMTAATPSGSTVTISLRVVSAPLWQLLLVLLIVIGGAWRLSRRVCPAGHCSACGYDLRGLGSGKCPECGEGFLARMMAKVRRTIERRRGIMPRRGASLSRA
ncbi:MAG: hypothetical protein IT434_05820 [Phycisphaerales bacterium]|jgi:hypothetical protein|nr:hypothetical protein [Phycisphaerales bacterium]